MNRLRKITAGLAAGAALAAAVWLPPAARAAPLYGIALEINPQRPFLFQQCSLELRITVSPGTELRSLRIEGLPDSDVLDIGPLREHPVKTLRLRGRTVEARRYTAPARPLSEGALSFIPTLQAKLLERRGGFFLNAWVEQPLRQTLPLVKLDVRPLPIRGRPVPFGMAVGQFDLTARLDPAETELGGLITLFAEVRGRGWPGDLPPAFRHPPEHFTVYPPRVLDRKPDGLLRSEQTLVARHPGPVTLPPVVFHYFDPREERYREAVAGPFPIRVTPAPTNATPLETVLDLAPAAPRASPNPTGKPRRLFEHSPGYSLKIWRRPLLLFLPFLVLAGLPFIRRHGGKALPPLLLAAGLTVLLISLQDAIRSAHAREFILPEAAELRLAPSPNALILRPLPRGTRVEQMEARENWLRIRVGETVGWMERPPGPPGPPDAD